MDELNESSDDSPFRLVPVDSAVRESVLTNDSFYQPLVNMKNIPPDICTSHHVLSLGVHVYDTLGFDKWTKRSVFRGYQANLFRICTIFVQLTVYFE